MYPNANGILDSVISVVLDSLAMQLSTTTLNVDAIIY